MGEPESLEIFLVCVVLVIVLIISSVLQLIVVPMWLFVVIFELYSISWLARIIRRGESHAMKVSLCVLIFAFMVLLLGFL